MNTLKENGIREREVAGVGCIMKMDRFMKANGCKAIVMEMAC